jgi:hypothetical protein
MLKNHASYRVTVAILVLAVMVLSACEPVAGTGEPEPSYPGKTKVDPDTLLNAPSQSRPEDIGEPVEVIPGQVTLSLSRSGFSQEEVIEFTVANGLDQVIYVEDMKTSCSIAILEVQEDNAWTPLFNCGMERMSMTLAIDPGMGRVVSIDPSRADVAVPGKSSLDPGTYRIRFIYRIEPGPEGDEPFSVLSEEFSVSG